MKKGVGTIIGVVLGGLGLYAGFQYLRSQYLLGYNFWDIAIKQLKINNLTANNADVTIKLGILNPTDVAVRISDVDMDVYYKGEFLVTAKRAESFSIPANDWGYFEMDFSLSYGEIAVQFTQFIEDFIKERPLLIELDGSFKVSGIGIPATIEFERNEFEYTANLAEDLGVANTLGSIKGWLNNNLGLTI